MITLLLALLLLGGPALAGPSADLAAHVGPIDETFVRAHGRPADFELLASADPIRALAWRGWLDHPAEARRIHLARTLPRRRGAGLANVPDDPALAAVFLDAALHTPDDAGLRAALARQGALLARRADLLDAAWAQGDPVIRASLVSGLRHVPGPLAGPLLTRAASHADPVLRATALAILSARPDAATWSTALLLATSDPDPEVRRLAVRGVGWHGIATGRDAVRRALADPIPGVRLAALRALNRLDPAEARAAAGPITTDPDPRVARAAREVSGG